MVGIVLVLTSLYLALMETTFSQSKLAKEGERLAKEVEVRRRAEIALRANEAYYRTLIENLTEVILVVDREGNITYTSPAVKRVFGYDAGPVRARLALKVVHRDDLEAARNAIATAMDAPGLARELRCRVRRRDGAWGAR